jgi:hypothetical protein
MALDFAEFGVHHGRNGGGMAGNAFFAMQRAFLSIFNAMLESSFSWALAVVLAVVVLAMDSMRGVFKRFR